MRVAVEEAILEDALCLDSKERLGHLINVDRARCVHVVYRGADPAQSPVISKCDAVAQLVARLQKYLVAPERCSARDVPRQLRGAHGLEPLGQFIHRGSLLGRHLLKLLVGPLIHWSTVEPLHDEDVLRRQPLSEEPLALGMLVIEGLGDLDSSETLQVLASLALQLRLAPVVELGGEALLQLPQHVDIVRSEGLAATDRQVNVDPKLPLCTRVLHLYHDLRAVQQPRPMCLADGCCANGFRVKAREDLVYWQAKVVLHDGFDLAVGHGGGVVTKYLEGLHVVWRNDVRILRQKLCRLHIETLLPEHDLQRRRGILFVELSEGQAHRPFISPTRCQLDGLVVQGNGQHVPVELNRSLETLICMVADER
mmetsp:Transcript_45072/g.97896  ORF Transcript_45072/g.97896 Transcript_45072/m.97896 type:complete len:368 (+) Transcript_45072:646-1749(+)